MGGPGRARAGGRGAAGGEKGSRPTVRQRGRRLVGREHAKRHQHSKRDAGFSLVAVQEHFAFRSGWYREDAVRGLVLAYYLVLRTAVRSRPDLRPCLTRCRHCRIFFLTHPRNRGRRDLSCPFGCRDAHRGKRSVERSTAYYGTPAGRMKKKGLNGKRRRAVDAGTGAEIKTPGPAPDKVGFDAGIVEHVRVVTSLIEGFEVSREEVLEMLGRTVRQHSIGRERRIDYVVRWLAEHFP